jgi:serine/threonine-protein kinase
MTPFTMALKPGLHQVTVGAGAQVRTQSVNVTSGGDTRIFFELPRVTGAVAGAAAVGGLQLDTEPPGAKVLIDGEARGVTPLTVSDLTTGEHVVVVQGTGEPVTRTVTVQEGAVASLVISLNSASAFASGWIAITGVPVQILENGTLLGSTEMPRILLPAGSHELELTNAELGYHVTRTVQVVAGQTLSIALKPPQGTLSINALPWAEVWVDGKPAGETPIGNLSLPIGNHELIFRHPELGEQRRTVTVGALAPVRVGVDLRK